MLQENNQSEKKANLDLVKSEIDKFLVGLAEKAKISKKVAIDEAWKILQLATSGVIQLIENLSQDLAGKQKKELAMALLDKFYDGVFVSIGIPFVPSFLEKLIHAYVKSLLMILVSSSIDALVITFKNAGIFKSKS